MNDPRPDNLPLEWLAAYADGELTPRERARVENWLAENLDARELLECQESLGPNNTEFWQLAQPPSPLPAQWLRLRNAIDAAQPVQPRRSWTRWLGAAGLLATAASLLVIVGAFDRPTPESPSIVEAPPLTPVADEPYAMASADDVRIISLPEAAANLLVVGDHPLNGSSMSLARFGEVEFLGIGSDLAGRFPAMPSDANTEEIPMIWAPRDP
jgi:hypothetical protein